MSKKFKLVPESFFNQIVNQKYDHEAALLQEKDRLLQSKDISDDKKVLLVQELLRQISNTRATLIGSNLRSTEWPAKKAGSCRVI